LDAIVALNQKFLWVKGVGRGPRVSQEGMRAEAAEGITGGLKRQQRSGKKVKQRSWGD
jgi:hypothetical protein